ncbi:MAG: small multi-drug export protein [Dehalococcoidales bacterium]
MYLQELLNLDISDILAVLAIAASPISELRGAIPAAIFGFHFPWYYAYSFSIIGNLLPVPFLLYFLNSIIRKSSKIGILDRILGRLSKNARQRGKIIERYERIGLVLFVAIPLPVTGAWTACLAAVLLGLRFKYALISISIGVLFAGIIVTSITFLGWNILGLLTN